MLCVKWYTSYSAPVQQVASKALRPLSVMVVSQEVMHETLCPFCGVALLHDQIKCASVYNTSQIPKEEYSESLFAFTET